MKTKLIIVLALLLLMATVLFMVRDFFCNTQLPTFNPYEYDISEFKEVPPDKICYIETGQIPLDFQKVKGIATDFKNRIYVTGDEKVVIYDRNGEPVSEFATGNTTSCISVSNNGTVFLGMGDHIEVFDFAGNRLHKWNPPSEKTYITSIAVDDTSVFIADAGNKIVYHYNTNGEFLNEIGKKDSLKGIRGFFVPSPYFDLLTGREGEVWIVNPGYHAFESYDKKGNLKYTWSESSMQLEGFSGCCNPTHIAMLSDGSFVTSEKGIERVKIHYPNGDFKCVVASPDQFEKGTTGLDLAVDGNDRILILDPHRNLVRIFREEKPA